MTALQLTLGRDGTWVPVHRCHPGARELADRHYSRQTHGAREFMPPGRTLVLLAVCGRAVWGAVENLDPAGSTRWRCSIFRNEGAGLSSQLVREATEITRRHWLDHYSGLPAVPLTTEVNPSAVRSANPGCCFRCAGWTKVEERRGLVVLQAPEPAR